MRILVLTILLITTAHAAAEPFLAVENGFHCVQCHVSPSGGGSRNQYGDLFIQTQLPASPASSDDLWTGTLANRFTLGADARYALREARIDGVDPLQDFTADRVSLYFSAKMNDRTRLYLDQQLAPGGSISRSAWMKFDLTDSLYLRAGKLFLPYGLRLEDDGAFIRQRTNINFNTADLGMEIGYIRDAWRVQGSVTNGTGGAAEIDRGKQFSVLASYVRPRWRLGASFNSNRTDPVDRRMGAVFAGLKTGPVVWLAEIDRIIDRNPGPLEQRATLLFAEADIRLTRGHYFRFTGEKARSDSVGIADQDRLSLEYLLFPAAFTQIRLGGRTYRSDDRDPFSNRDELFAQVHLFF